MGHCPEHGEFADTADGGIRAVVRCPQCEAEERAEREREHRGQRVAQLTRIAGIPPRYRLRTFDQYRIESAGQRQALSVVRGYARTFPERLEEGRNLVLTGSVGTGKTHLSVALLRWVIEQEALLCRYATAQAVSLRVRATYDKGAEETYQRVIADYVSPELLVLDEVGVQGRTDHERRIFYDVLNGRYEQMRPTVLVTNLAPAGLTDFLGERVMDRLQEGGCDLVRFDWQSYRAKAAQDDQLPSRTESVAAAAEDRSGRRQLVC